MQITGMLSPARPVDRRGIGGAMVMEIAGAVAFVAHIVARSVLTAGVDPVESARGALWIPVNAVGAIGAGMVVMGMPAIAGRLATPGSRRGAIGLALLAGSWGFVGVFLSLHAALVLPWIAREAPHLLAEPTPAPVTVAFALALLAWLGGAALLAREARDRWVRWALPGSAMWFLVGSFVIAPEGPAERLAVNLASNMGPVLLVVALGYTAFRAGSESIDDTR